MRYNVLQVHWFYLLATAFHYAMPLSHTALHTFIRAASLAFDYLIIATCQHLLWAFNLMCHLFWKSRTSMYLNEILSPASYGTMRTTIALLICVLFTFIYCIHWLIYGWQFSHLFNNRYHACCYFPVFSFLIFWGMTFLYIVDSRHPYTYNTLSSIF